jgi:hypothetical protein
MAARADHGSLCNLYQTIMDRLLRARTPTRFAGLWSSTMRRVIGDFIVRSSRYSAIFKLPGSHWLSRPQSLAETGPRCGFRLARWKRSMCRRSTSYSRVIFAPERQRRLVTLVDTALWLSTEKCASGIPETHSNFVVESTGQEVYFTKADAHSVYVLRAPTICQVKDM